MPLNLSHRAKKRRGRKTEKKKEMKGKEIKKSSYAGWKTITVAVLTFAIGVITYFLDSDLWGLFDSPHAEQIILVVMAVLMFALRLITYGPAALIDKLVGGVPPTPPGGDPDDGNG